MPYLPNTKSIGDLGVARTLSRLLESGYAVSLPFGDNLRYDLIIDDGQHLLRVQCKTGRLDSKGSIAFPVCSCANHRGRGRRDYRGDIDAFGVYCPDTESVYLVPMSVLNGCRREARLRVHPARNAQVKGTRMASAFLLDPYRDSTPAHISR
ncbi:MAG: hypothetical protein KJ011_07300 [Burkholderiaceae bacterium]|nr:hypothetical protein [Burkholderiaceae bacterium]